MADTEMAKIFGIPVDDRDKEKTDETNLADDGGNRTFYEDVDRELMENDANDVNDAHYDELVTVYDKENPVIAVGKLFPSMGEFRMCFKIYAIMEFDAKTQWTDKNKFDAKMQRF